MKRLCIVQPLLSHYSRVTFLELAQYCDVDVIFSPAPQASGFGEDFDDKQHPGIRYVEVPTFRPLGQKIGLIQWGIAKYLLQQRPDVILLSADPRYVSFWGTLLLAKILGIPAYAHGHGHYKKQRLSILHRLITIAVLRLVTSYICYAPSVRNSFIRHGFPSEKLAVADNSLTNYFQVLPEEKNGSERGILFLGRLRENNDLQSLIRAIDKLRNSDHLLLTLHVIGSGEQSDQLKTLAHGHPWVIFHGGIYDHEHIAKISRECFAGCYPGNAGLSVIHMMSLSLPPITHSDLPAHGPEPSFILNGSNGLLFRPGDVASLAKVIKSLAVDPARLKSLQCAAFHTFQALANPPLAARIWSIIAVGGDFDARRPINDINYSASGLGEESDPKKNAPESRSGAANPISR